jgi:hypothetical protein
MAEKKLITEVYYVSGGKLNPRRLNLNRIKYETRPVPYDHFFTLPSENELIIGRVYTGFKLPSKLCESDRRLHEKTIKCLRRPVLGLLYVTAGNGSFDFHEYYYFANKNKEPVRAKPKNSNKPDSSDNFADRFPVLMDLRTFNLYLRQKELEVEIERTKKGKNLTKRCFETFLQRFQTHGELWLSNYDNREHSSIPRFITGQRLSKHYQETFLIDFINDRFYGGGDFCVD